MAACNVLICGTPGTGKSSLAAELALRTGMQHINISELVKERKLYSSYDEEFDSYIIDEDKVIDEMEDPTDLNVPGGGKIVEYHGCEFFPERFFQLVVVLSTDNTILWGRLEGRGYSLKKIQENIEVEIMKTILDEAQNSYSQEIIMELPSNTTEDMENNLQLLQNWLQQRMH